MCAFSNFNGSCRPLSWSSHLALSTPSSEMRLATSCHLCCDWQPVRQTLPAWLSDPERGTARSVALSSIAHVPWTCDMTIWFHWYPWYIIDIYWYSIMDITWVKSKRKLAARATFHKLAFYFATFKQHEMFQGCRVSLPCTAPLSIENVRRPSFLNALNNISDAHASNIGAQANP